MDITCGPIVMKRLDDVTKNQATFERKDIRSLVKCRNECTLLQGGAPGRERVQLVNISTISRLG